MSDFSIRLLGTGNPFPSLERSGPASVLLVEGRPYLIDAGDGVMHQLLRAGINPARIEHFFLTHHHSDHTVGYPAFVMGSWTLGRQRLHVFGPRGTEMMTDMLFRVFMRRDVEYRVGLSWPASAMEIQVEEVDDGWTYRLGDLQVTARLVKHYPRMECFGFRFEYGGKVIAHTGDTAYCAGAVLLARGADVLVNNCSLCLPPDRHPPAQTPERWAELRAMLETHTCTPQAAGRIAREAGAKKLVLIHMQPSADPAYIAQAAATEFGGEIIVGEDLMEIEA